MKETTTRPRYPFPWKTAALALWDALLDRPRSFRADAIQSVRLCAAQPQLINPNHIPASGPCLLVMNHYSRPGFAAWWIALGISAAVPVEIHWIMTAAWNHLGPLAPLTRLAFPRVAQIYRFTSMPAMPPDPREVEARAQAVRRVLQVARMPGLVIGLAPEGRDHPGGILGQPPPGVGRFILQLVRHCQPIVPIGVYEDGETLCFNFGPPFRLDISPSLPPGRRDQYASRVVMQGIARQLPPGLRGIYDHPEGSTL